MGYENWTLTDFPSSLQTLETLIHSEDVEILDPRFGRLLVDKMIHYDNI